MFVISLRFSRSFRQFFRVYQCALFTGDLKMATKRNYNAEDVLEAVYQDDGSEFEEELSDEEHSDPEDMSDDAMSESGGQSAAEGDNDTDTAHVPISSSGRRRARNPRLPRTVFMLNWEDYDDFDPFECDWLPNYQRPHGILVDTSDFKPVDYFSLFFPDEALTLMAEETNRYAMQYLDSTCDFPQSSRLHKWYDTSVEEMKAYLALQIAMGLCQKPSLEDYWSTFWITFTDFKRVMPRNRFEILQTFLHFNDITKQIPKGQEGYDPLFKIQTLLDICESSYETVYQPKKCLAIDESMVKFKGRIFFRQYLPAKPTRWGIKAFILSESDSGYCLRSKVYTGKHSFQREPGTLLTESVVTSLLDGYEDKGHIVYMDNFYSSPHLFSVLEEKNIGACGTVRANRVGMPNDLKPKNLKLSKGDDPVFMRSGNLVACAWHDTKRLTLLSTVNTNLTIDKRIKSKGAVGGYRTIEKPVIAEQYNDCMAGVDRPDQLLGSYQFPHKCFKWYHTLFHRAQEIALVNGYIIYCKASESNKLDPVRFRQNVITGLLEDWEPRQIKQGRPSNTPTPQRMTGQHFPGKYEDKKFKPDCEVCSDRKNGKRHQTSYYCKQCNIPLCVVPCFERYHTLRNYKE